MDWGRELEHYTFSLQLLCNTTPQVLSPGCPFSNLGEGEEGGKAYTENALKSGPKRPLINIEKLAELIRFKR